MLEGVQKEFLEEATKRYHEEGAKLERESSDDEDENAGIEDDSSKTQKSENMCEPIKDLLEEPLDES